MNLNTIRNWKTKKSVQLICNKLLYNSRVHVKIVECSLTSIAIQKQRGFAPNYLYIISHKYKVKWDCLSNKWPEIGCANRTLLLNWKHAQFHSETHSRAHRSPFYVKSEKCSNPHSTESSEKCIAVMMYSASSSIHKIRVEYCEFLRF